MKLENLVKSYSTMVIRCVSPMYLFLFGNMFSCLVSTSYNQQTIE